MQFFSKLLNWVYPTSKPQPVVEAPVEVKTEEVLVLTEELEVKPEPKKRKPRKKAPVVEVSEEPTKPVKKSRRKPNLKVEK